MGFDINIQELVSAVVAKTETDTRAKKEYLSSKAFRFEAPKEQGVTNTYIVKLLPWTKDGKEGFSKTFVYRYQYRWQSTPEPGAKFGKWNYITSAGNIKEPCPIDEWRFEFLKANAGNSEEIKRVLQPLNRNEVRVMNILVVDDPVHPDNNGKVFPVELNKVLWGIVDGALHGEFDEQFSEIRGSAVNLAQKVFDLSPNGVNLRVRVSLNNGNIPSYGNSDMTFSKTDLFGPNGIKPCAADLERMLREGVSLKDIVFERIENDVIDPMEYVKDGIRPYDEVKRIFVKTFLSNPKISMHISSKWMSNGEDKPAPRVVPTAQPTAEVHSHASVGNTSTPPTFAESDDMEDFMNELASEQGM